MISSGIASESEASLAAIVTIQSHRDDEDVRHPFGRIELARSSSAPRHV